MLKPFWSTRTKAAITRQRDSARPLHVLIVDDDPDVCRLLETALIAFGGSEVHVANGAKAAMRILEARDKPVDGVFLDIQMPGMSGTELCATIKAMPGYRNVPIIMLTAMADQRYLSDAFAAGASDYMIKPFDFDEIRAKFSRERSKMVCRENLKEPSLTQAASGRDPTGEVIRALEDAISMQGVERCITREAFDNYLLKTAARSGEDAYVRATKIARVFELFTELSASEYQAAVIEIARAISAQTTASRDVIAYSGNGVFLSLSIGKSTLKPSDLTDAVKTIPTLAHLAGHRVHLIIGDEVPLSRNASADVLFALQSAIDVAETAETKNFGFRSYIDWLSARKSVGLEQRRVQKAAYGHILNDILMESERRSK